MKPPAFCAYPPQIAADVEISPRGEGESHAFVIGSPEVGRYLGLGMTEHRVIQLLDGTATPADVCGEMERRHRASLQPATLARFLKKLDETGILAGGHKPSGQALVPGNQFYLRWRLFNPDRLFARVLPAVRWIWTPGFLGASLVLMALSGALALMNWTEVAGYGGQVLREHYVAVLAAAWIVIVSHEFAHGMTAKAFGGRATEIGALLIYYCLPALYCNVSGLHLIPERGHRLWVIAAGVFWQLLVGAAALLACFAFAPHTLLSDLSMIVALGSVLNVVFNANPLIKLDGYYFLSQWLRLPNLMDRAGAYWHGMIHGEERVECLALRDRQIFFVFGLLSFSYNLALPLTILWLVSQYLMDVLHFGGLLIGFLFGLVYARAFLKRTIAAAERFFKRTKSVNEGNTVSDHGTNADVSGRAGWRRRLAIPGLAAIGAIGLCIPWTASVGSYGTLTARPDREAIIRAPEDGSLISLKVQPGQRVEPGAPIARLGNLDLEEQIVQIRGELAHVRAEAARLSGELGVQQENIVGGELQLNQRQRELSELEAEEQQIRAAPRNAPGSGRILASLSSNSVGAAGPPAGESSPPQFPAALAALEAEVELRNARLPEANSRLQRTRRLFEERIVARNDMEVAESNASMLASDLAAARQRLNAALVEHRRRLRIADTDFELSRASLAAGRAQATNLGSQLEATNRMSDSLEERLALLERKSAQFALVAPAAGTVFGEDLARMGGQFFTKGMEICRIADTSELLVRVQVPEREIGDIRNGCPVRLKTRAFPGSIFRGVVSRIGGESDPDRNQQATYRVELTIQNEESLLRPGMTVFARIDFSRHMTGWILAHKFRQALRPEMWML